MRYWFKQCPRCRGELHEEADLYGRYISCLQCGYILSQAEELRLISTGTLKEPLSDAKAA